MKLSKIVLFAALLGAAGCGPQYSQQGTWSRDDGFRHKQTLGVKEPKEKPSDTAR